MVNNNRREQSAILKGYNMLLYFAGSMIMYEPTEECVSDFMASGIVKKLPVSSTNPRFFEAAARLRQSCENLTFCNEILKDDYNRLFSGSGPMLASPFKSEYIRELQLPESDRENVSDFYNTYGWKFRSRYNIKDDHLGIELLFLTLLIDKYIGFDDKAVKMEMKNEIRRFIDWHIFSWINEWNKKVQEHALTNCYKGIALMIYAGCEDIYNMFEITFKSSEQRSEVKN
jgi:TorA maturation chaperone TorD